jgi:hypothetical protein
MQMEGERMERLRDERLGEGWIRAITDGRLDRLAQLCNPQVFGRLLLPRGLVSLDNAVDLVAEYRDWFGEYERIELEASRVARVGQRLGVFYRLLLWRQAESERIEQQLYLWLMDDKVQQLHLLCSGFQPASRADRASGSAAVS